MQRKRLRSNLSLCCVTLSLLACGKPSDDDTTPDDGPRAGASGDAAGSPGTGAGGSSTYGNAGSGSAGGSSTMPTSDFEGIPTMGIPYGKAPSGCTVAAAGGNADTLLLTLDDKIKTVLVSGKDGNVVVNGVTCSAVSAPKLVKVVGSAAADVVIVDFSLGALPTSLTGGTIQIDPGTSANKDTVAIAVTRGDDAIHLGTNNGADLVQLGAELPQLKLTSAEVLILSTGPGNDKVDASGGSSLGKPLATALTVYGGADADEIQGGAGADQLHAGAGDDVFYTAAASDGADVYDGGADEDSLSYEKRTAAVTIKIDKVANDGEVNEKDDVQDNIETLIGGEGADTINAGEIDNLIIGGPGNDMLNGGGGNDTLRETTTAQGADNMNGGTGVDTIDYNERSGDLNISLCIPSPTTCITGQCNCTGDDGENNEKDALVNVENAQGGRGHDVITGSSADNTLNGNEGNDLLTGVAGDDTLYAGDGDDNLSGGPGDDTLYGNAGKDSFDAGDGQGDICIISPTETPLNCELH